MASTIAAITTSGGGIVTTADASGNLSLLSGATTVVAVTSAGVDVTGTLSATGVSTFAAGTAALPALISTGDPNTGVWFPAADTVAASTAGSERLRIDSSGNVGIGTATPLTKLDVAGGSVAASNFFTPATAGTLGTSTTSVVSFGSTGSGGLTNTLQFNTNSAERMRIDSSGNVGIGTSSPVKSLQVNGAIIARGGAPGVHNTNNNGFAFQGNSGDLDSGLYSIADGMVNIFTNSMEVARFDSDKASFGSGAVNASRHATVNIVSASSSADWNHRQLLVEDTTGGAGSPAIGFHAPANATAAVFKMYGPTNAFEFRNAVDTAFVNVYAAAFVPSSDYRLKEDVAPLQNSLTTLLALKPVSFVWKESKKADVGFIAHEVQDHVPEAVFGEKDGMRPGGEADYQGVNQSPLVALCVKAIQEQQALITQLQADVSTLKGVSA
jgi:hypothetical protein